MSEGVDRRSPAQVSLGKRPFASPFLSSTKCKADKSKHHQDGAHDHQPMRIFHQWRPLHDLRNAMKSSIMKQLVTYTAPRILISPIVSHTQRGDDSRGCIVSPPRPMHPSAN